MGLGGQVGKQKGAKIDAKRHRKNDGKKKGRGSGLEGLGFTPPLVRGMLESPPCSLNISILGGSGLNVRSAIFDAKVRLHDRF